MPAGGPGNVGVLPRPPRPPRPCPGCPAGGGPPRPCARRGWTSAAEAATTSRTNTMTGACLGFIERLLRTTLEQLSQARRWVPRRAVREPLEIGRRDERVAEIGGIFDDARDREPGLTEVLVMVEIFGEDGLLAVGHAVLSQEARREARGRDRQM